MNFKKILILLCLISTSLLNAQTEKTEKDMDENYIFQTKTVMPYFKSEQCEGYEELDDRTEFNKCSFDAMWEFINENLKYPEKARKKKIEGMVVIGFLVTEEGSIHEAKILRDIGGGCGKEALRVVNMMPNWQAGKFNGELAVIKFNLPIKFNLEKTINLQN